MKIKAAFEVMDANGVGHFHRGDGYDFRDKSNDISGISIKVDLKKSPPLVYLIIERYYEYSGGCAGYYAFADECYGEYKKILDAFLAKDIDNKLYVTSTAISINSHEHVFNKAEAMKLTQDFLDSIFESFELSKADQLTLINYCKKGGFTYRFPGQENNEVAESGFFQNLFSMFSGSQPSSKSVPDAVAPREGSGSSAVVPR